MDSLPPPDAKSRIPASGEQEKHGVVTLKSGLYFAALKTVRDRLTVRSDLHSHRGGWWHSPTPQASWSATFPSSEYARRDSSFFQAWAMEDTLSRMHPDEKR
jgi:hypothetical protein